MPIEILDATSGEVIEDVLTNWSANAALGLLLDGKRWLSAYLANPTQLGNVGTEVAGGGYQRQPITFGPASNRTRVSVDAQTFPGMPECIVRYLAVHTAISGGFMVFAKKLTNPILVSASGQLLVTAGDVALSL